MRYLVAFLGQDAATMKKVFQEAGFSVEHVVEGEGPFTTLVDVDEEDSTLFILMQAMQNNRVLTFSPFNSGEVQDEAA